MGVPSADSFDSAARRVDAQQRASRGVSASAAGSASSDTSSAGYSLESDRRAAIALQEERAKAAEPAVRPVFLIAAVAAAVFFFAVVIFRARGSSHLEYDNKSILDKYATYLKGKSGSRLPSLDYVRRELNGIVYLENTGRSEDAREALRSLITAMPADPQNPVYQVAVKQLDSLQ